MRFSRLGRRPRSGVLLALLGERLRDRDRRRPLRQRGQPLLVRLEVFRLGLRPRILRRWRLFYRLLGRLAAFGLELLELAA